MTVDVHNQITQYLLRIQDLLEEDHAENLAIQEPFNALVCAIDEEFYD